MHYLDNHTHYPLVIHTKKKANVEILQRQTIMLPHYILFFQYNVFCIITQRGPLEDLKALRNQKIRKSEKR